MMREEIASEIANVTFTERTFAPGYDRMAVDDFLDRLRDAVLGGDSVDDLRALVDAALFTTRRGAYDQGEVDSFLDRIVIRCADVAPDERTDPGRRRDSDRRADRPSGPSALPVLSTGSALIEPPPSLFARIGRRLRKG